MRYEQKELALPGQGARDREYHILNFFIQEAIFISFMEK